MKKLFLFILLFMSFPIWADVLSDREEFFLNMEYVYYIRPLLFAMFLTAIVETFLLWCFKYRGWKILTIFFILNLISNLFVNALYERIWQLAPYFVVVPLLEAGVVLFEFGMLGLMFKYSKKLLGCVFLTNLISFLLGILLFGM